MDKGRIIKGFSFKTDPNKKPFCSYCDLTLICGDSSVLLAHCSVVAAVSKFLQVDQKKGMNFGLRLNGCRAC